MHPQPHTRPRTFPAYPARPHKASGQARVKIQGRHVYLGRFGTAASRAKYAALAANFAATDTAPAPTGPNGHAHLTIEVFARFLADAKVKKSDKELWHYRRVASAVAAVVDELPAVAFDVAALERVRDALIAGSWLSTEARTHPKAGGWSRNHTNAAMRRVRTVWRWAEYKGLVRPGAWSHLRTLPALARTDRHVRQTKPREGVEWGDVAAVLPCLPAAVAAMAEVQWWTGMRPCEVCRMRAGDVEWSGAGAGRIPEESRKNPGTVVYWLQAGKNLWRAGREGAEAVILGPEAQRVIRPWLDAARSKGGDAPIFPSVRAGCCYTTGGYAQAVAGAFERNPGLLKWTPYQLRHGAKRRIKRAVGLDAARAVLRQSSISTADGYDRERDMVLATDAAKRTG